MKNFAILMTSALLLSACSHSNDSNDSNDKMKIILNKHLKLIKVMTINKNIKSH